MAGQRRPRGTSKNQAIVDSQKAAVEARETNQAGLVKAQQERIAGRELQQVGHLGRRTIIGGVPHRQVNIRHLQGTPTPAWVPESDIRLGTSGGVVKPNPGGPAGEIDPKAFAAAGGQNTITVNPRNALHYLTKQRMFGEAGKGIVTGSGTVAPSSRARKVPSSKKLVGTAPMSDYFRPKPRVEGPEIDAETHADNLIRNNQHAGLTREQLVQTLVTNGQARTAAQIAAAKEEANRVPEEPDYAAGQRVRDAEAAKAAQEAAATAAERAAGMSRIAEVRARPDYTPAPSAAHKIVGEWLRRKRAEVTTGAAEGLNVPRHKSDVKLTKDEVIHPGDPANGIDPIIAPKGSVIARAGEAKLPKVNRSGQVLNAATPQVGFSRKALLASAVEAEKDRGGPLLGPKAPPTPVLQGPMMENGKFYSEKDMSEEEKRPWTERNANVRASRQLSDFMAPNQKSLQELNRSIFPLQVPTSGPRDPHTGRPILGGALEMPSGNPRFNRSAVRMDPHSQDHLQDTPLEGEEQKPYEVDRESGPLSTDVNERAEKVNPYLNRMAQGAWNYESLPTEEKLKGENMNAVVKRESRPRGLSNKKK